MAWYNASWSYRRRLTIVKSKVIADVTDFPVYVDLANFDNTFWSNVQNGGADIRVVNSSDTEVPIEVVSCVTSSKTGQLYFKATLSSAMDTIYYIYYGNAGAAAYAVTDTYGRNNVWTNAYMSVYHLETASYVNAQGNTTYNGTNGSSTEAVGIAGSGKAFNGSSAYINLGNQSITAGTWSAWIYPNATQVNYAKVMNKSTTGAAPYCRYNITYTNSSPKTIGSEIAVGTTQYSAGKTTAPSTTSWSFVAGRYDGTTLSFYLNGAQNGGTSTIAGTIATNTVNLNLGRSPFTTPSEWYAGSIDEVRIQTSARAAGWITTEYNNISDNASFITISSQQTTPVKSVYNGPHNITDGATLNLIDFDNGGEALGYHDVDAANQGGAYRTDEGVDIEASAVPAGYNIGWTSDGEWTEYTCNVTGGTYTISLYAASPNTGGQVQLYQDAVLKATYNIVSTTGWQVWQAFTASGVALTAGNNSVLKVLCAVGGVNIDRLTFTLEGSPPQPSIPIFWVVHSGVWKQAGMLKVVTSNTWNNVSKPTIIIGQAWQ